MDKEWTKIGQEHNLTKPNVTVYRQEPWSECPHCGEFRYTRYRYKQSKIALAKVKEGYYCTHCEYREAGEDTSEKAWKKKVKGGLSLDERY